MRRGRLFTLVSFCVNFAGIRISVVYARLRLFCRLRTKKTQLGSQNATECKYVFDIFSSFIFIITLIGRVTVIALPTRTRTKVDRTENFLCLSEEFTSPTFEKKDPQIILIPNLEEIRFRRTEIPRISLLKNL